MVGSSTKDFASAYSFWNFSDEEPRGGDGDVIGAGSTEARGLSSCASSWPMLEYDEVIDIAAWEALVDDNGCDLSVGE